MTQNLSEKESLGKPKVKKGGIKDDTQGVECLRHVQYEKKHHIETNPNQINVNSHIKILKRYIYLSFYYLIQHLAVTHKHTKMSFQKWGEKKSVAAQSEGTKNQTHLRYSC